jgi:acyl carrier protein
MTTWTESSIHETIRNTILFEGLELDGLGLKPEELTVDTLLLADEGLALDSVDALEIVVSVQKVFGLSIPNLDAAFFETNLRTVGTLVDYVANALRIGSESS